MAVMNRVASSASSSKDTINLMIWEMVRIGPLDRGLGSSSERKM